MTLDLYAGIAVSGYPTALAWSEKLFGSPPTLVASDTEAVWDLAEHRSVVIKQQPKHAGHAMHTISQSRAANRARASCAGNGAPQ